MANKHYDEAIVIKLLMKKHELNIDTRAKMIHVMKEPQNLGLRSWAKISYLCNYCGYRYGYTMVVRSVKPSKRQASNDDIETFTKASKKQNKLNMANMAKSAMKKVKHN